MHKQQVRLTPRASAADVEKVLRKVKKKGINLEAIGGSNLEFGGELALVPEHGKEVELRDLLSAYNARIVDVDDPDSGLTVCVADHQAGGLHACLEATAIMNLESGRIIRDILIGVPDEAQFATRKVPVQIYSEQIKTAVAPDDPDDLDD